MNIERPPKQQVGSVMLEALIAILIFSVGVLALVGMQATAISNVSDAKYRSTAGFLADQIVGTIWARRVGSVAANASNVMVASPDTTFACNPCNGSTGNAFTQSWFASGVNAELPNGQAIIAISGALVTVTISWLPPKDTTRHQHVVRTTID